MRSKGEGTIRYDEKRQEWIGAVSYNGKRYFFYSGKNGRRRDVVQKMDDWRVMHNKEDFSSKKGTISQLMDDWLITIKKPALKPTSYDRLESTVNCQIKPRIGIYTLDELTDTVIQKELLDEMKEDGLGVSSLKKAYNAIQEFLNYAVYKRYIPFNPMGLMKTPTVDGFEDADIDIEDENPDKVQPLTMEERNLLRQWAGYRWKREPHNLRYPTAAGFILIMNTGMRMGEALALKWTDVDFEKSVIHVTKNLVIIKNREKTGPKQRIVIQNTPKTNKSRRDIPINKEALSALAILQRLKGTSDGGYVIHTSTGDAMLPRSFQQSLDLLCKAAGIRKIGVHTLRHTYATRLYEKGIDVKIISELLGHSSVDITYKIYIHIFEQTKRSAVQALDLD